MNKKAIFSAWAPPDGHWSAWVKPVLFAHLNVLQQVPAYDVSAEPSSVRLPQAEPTTALVFDLPGPKGVYFAMAAARRGYQPVFLHNVLPLPHPEQEHAVLIDMVPTMQALAAASQLLQDIISHEKRPPAFVLEARRFGGVQKPSVDIFDNRSRVFTTDFPSVQQLTDAGVRRIFLVQEEMAGPKPDLRDVVTQWQAGGVTVYSAGLKPGEYHAVKLPRHSWWRAVSVWFHRQNVEVLTAEGGSSS